MSSRIWMHPTHAPNLSPTTLSSIAAVTLPPPPTAETQAVLQCFRHLERRFAVAADIVWGLVQPIVVRRPLEQSIIQ